jgi:L-arabinose isomerase
MASAETQALEDGRVVQTRPRIGVLGIMQALYDDMLPGITERQSAYAAEVAAALGGVAAVETAPPTPSAQSASSRAATSTACWW